MKLHNGEIFALSFAYQEFAVNEVKDNKEILYITSQ